MEHSSISLFFSLFVCILFARLAAQTFIFEQKLSVGKRRDNGGDERNGHRHAS